MTPRMRMEGSQQRKELVEGYRQCSWHKLGTRVLFGSDWGFDFGEYALTEVLQICDILLGLVKHGLVESGPAEGGKKKINEQPGGDRAKLTTVTTRAQLPRHKEKSSHRGDRPEHKNTRLPFWGSKMCPLSHRIVSLTALGARSPRHVFFFFF